MDTAKLKRFAQSARRDLLEQVATRLELVLQPNSPARRENPTAIKQIDEQIAAIGKAQLVDKVAYTWFNRFCALRYMDVNRVNRIGVVSPVEGQIQPELLAEAKMGHMDVDMVPAALQGTVGDLLGGRATSPDPQGEAYRLLVVAACNYWHNAMPFLFERIADYTELLMPDDLLSGNSILADVRDAMTVDACQDVEVIGWLYQFYISEKKDAVFDGMKKGKKITPDNIPAATQLFTPHWIVRYLLENSLGRLWMLNHPDSKLIEQMEYYIRPEQAETDFLRITKPEDIKVCDPACGSGHMLTYAFDLLYAIYEEAGTDASEIPAKILTHNLYGIEIDERAGDLAAFALSMKARAKQRRFFSKPIEPNICVLEKVGFSADELDAYMEAVGRDLFTLDLRETLKQFEEADNFGSLIRPKLTNVRNLLPLLEAKDLGGQLFLRATHDKVLKVLRQADYLSAKYQVVVANPPYMGGKGMNTRLGTWAKQNYPDNKSDLFSMFIERGIVMTVPAGLAAMVTMQNWMFLSSFEAMRKKIIDECSVETLIQIGYNSFPELNSKVAQACAFVVANGVGSHSGQFINLNDAPQSADKEAVFFEQLSGGCIHVVDQRNFKNIPGAPFIYWASDDALKIFSSSKPLSAFADIGKGLDTGENEKFLRRWHEVSKANAGWVPCQKGGVFRKWFGNNEFVINWCDDGRELRNFDGANLRNSHNYFREGLSWTRVSSGNPAFRFFPAGHIFESTGPCLFSSELPLPTLAAFLNSSVSLSFLKMLAPSLDFQSGHVSRLPAMVDWKSSELLDIGNSCIEMGECDWNAFEISMDFSRSSLVDEKARSQKISDAYATARINWEVAAGDMQRLEQKSNQILIDAYGLQSELTPEVPLTEITLTCNPHYRYGSNKTEAELETLLLADTLREFVSYAVGCMFGRYSLDKPGLVLANQGETLADYLRQVPQPTFAPDADNVIPVLDGEWFNDDITERFRSFLRVTFGDAHYAENLQFIEDTLGKDIRKFFLRDFYSDHVKRYRKRPIYWLFSSPKGSFNALIYLHRYRPDTSSVVLQYLRDFQEKLAGERKRQEQISISASASQAEKTRALKSIDSLKKTQAELDDYERDVLHPLATQQIAIDLDDGVKVNYLKFGAALKKIPGLEAKDED